MSFVIGTNTFTPKTLEEHATEMLAYMNSYFIENDIRDSLGNVVNLVASSANVVWLMLLAVGKIRSDYDVALDAAIDSFIVSLASEQQVQNLLPIAGTSLLSGKFSYCNIDVTASALGDATVPEGTTLPFSDETTFQVVEETVVPAGTTVAILTRSTETGAYTVVPGQLDSFSYVITNVETVTNTESSTEGRKEETVSEIRERIISGNTIEIAIDGTLRAIKELVGILDAVVYFNPSVSENLVLPGTVTLLPRNAKIFILGTDEEEKIAEEYFARMTAPTTGTLSCNYTTLSGQTITVNYDEATEVDVWVKVYVKDLSFEVEGYDVIIKERILTLQSSLIIGTILTQEKILSTLENFEYATINGAEVSLAELTGYGRLIEPTAGEKIILSTDHIIVEVE